MGLFKITHKRAGLVLKKYQCHNEFTTSGLERVIRQFFTTFTIFPPSTEIGLIDSTVTDISDTGSIHPGWDEILLVPRGTWVQDTPAAASNPYSHTGTAILTAGGTAAAKGVFLINSLLLFATAIFPATIDLQENDTLEIGYTLTITGL